MAQAKAFISHSSADQGFARDLAGALRANDVDVWIDHEQINFGESVPGRISSGLSECDVILVLLSRSFVASSWCRAEYEPILTKEIDSGRTLVIPVRLDDCEIPTLLSAKIYADLRGGIKNTVVTELARGIISGRTVTRVNRLLPQRQTSYECSVLGMIISGVLRDFPVHLLRDSELLHDRSLLNLYKAIETLIDRFQQLCDEILQVLLESDIQNHFYGSARRVGPSRLPSANRKLRSIASDMRELSRSLDGILKRESALRTRLSELLQVCASISVAEDFLVINLGMPVEVSDKGTDEASRWGLRTGEMPGLDIHDNIKAPFYLGELGQQMVEDFQRVLGELDEYKRNLRRETAKIVAEGT